MNILGKNIGLISSALILGGTAVHGADAPKKPAKKPNILILMTDQHHADWIGCLGRVPVKTPHLDRLAGEGTLFSRSFVPVTFSSPTRAALVTGRYPCMLGIDRNIKEKDDTLRLREPARTFHHLLAEAGYHNRYLGKWHVGDLSELNCFPFADQDLREANRRVAEARQTAGENIFDPQREGEAAPIQNIYLTEGVATRHTQLVEKFPRKNGQDLGLIGRERIKAEWQNESILADYCIDLIREHHAKDEPFAITYSVSPPHPLYTAPAPYYDMYDPATLPLPNSWTHHNPLLENSFPAQLAALYGEEGLREFLRCYYAQVSMIDAYIGRIIESLRQEGILDETLVVFLSDHGNLCGHHGLIDKTVTTAYDDLMRVPTIIRLPGVFPAGKREDRFITTMDIGATILETVGVKPLKGSVGRSFRDMANGGATLHTAVFNERGSLFGNNGKLHRTVRTEKWKLILASDGTKELFDLIADPEEINNLAANTKYDAVIAELIRSIHEHMDSIKDPGRYKFL
jgi:arylsulfatase A-like enzyme